MAANLRIFAIPNRRSPDAALSPAELVSLTRVAFGLGSLLPKDHRDTLIRMELARLDDTGILFLTDAGRMRYERETARRV
jgi:hypothetical protein